MKEKWILEKEIELNGKRVKAWVPNPAISRERAMKRFIKLTEIIAKRPKKIAS